MLEDLIGFITRPPVIAIGAFLLLFFGAFGYLHHHTENVEMPKAYQAWVKLTGNDKCLSFDEWRSLVRAGEPQSGGTYIIPITTNYR